jgi:fructosamine-3-kinase
MPTSPHHAIAAALNSSLIRSAPVGGGCIHDARRLTLADGRDVFIKSARGTAAACLAAEARGLALLDPHLRVPHVLGEGTTAEGTRWIALEWLELRSLSATSWADLGRQLATLHAVTDPCHGLDHDNFIGSTPQLNSPCASWPEFFIERRLRPQLALARANGHPVPESEILAFAATKLANHQPAASLLHGDLWSGNAAALPDATAVVFDPAPYHGDAETDLAMLELFGGPLPSAFLHGYGPLAPDRMKRRSVYDLYHALNHLNLFGVGYATMVRRCLGQ